MLDRMLDVYVRTYVILDVLTTHIKFSYSQHSSSMRYSVFVLKVPHEAMMKDQCLAYFERFICAIFVVDVGRFLFVKF